jgi:hypothetical protein
MNVERKTGTYTADVVSVGNLKPIKVFPSRVQLAEKLEDYSRRYRELFVR